jgi:hypothetical protein
VFLLPGWILGRILGTPLAVATAFLGSAAIVFNLVLLLDGIGLPVDLRTVGCATAALSLLLAGWALRRGASLSLRWQRPHMPKGSDWLWLIPPALALTSIAARTLIEPLSGFDNKFRWDFLARLILSRHSLAFYPPVSMADFDLYAWCDGIPPLVPFLNFLIYAASGSAAPGLISIRAVAEFLILAALVYRLARDVWGTGWASLGVMGGCTLLIWGVAIEQETGLTAIALIAMLLFLRKPKDGASGAPSWTPWAAVAAGVGAISREYGLYFVILGAAVLVFQCRRRSLAGFLIPAAIVCGPWYVRNGVKTGNPVFPAMGSLFPTNAIHVEVMRDIANFWGFRSAPVPLATVPWTLLATLGAVGFLGLAGLVRLRLRGLAIASGIALVTLLWIWSMPQTAGGWTYSMRVLLPALALGSAAAGFIGTLRPSSRVAFALLAGLLSVDAARRSWLLPDDPTTTPWTLSFAEWRMFREQDRPRPGADVWSILAGAAADRYIVVDNPQPFVTLTALGAHPTPLESPRFAAAFDSSLSVEEAVRRLRALKVRFVTFSVRNPVVKKLVERHKTLRTLAEDYSPSANLGGLLVFDLEFMSRKP